MPALTCCRAVTCCSGPQVPFRSSATNGCALLELSVNHPPTAQLPGDEGAQDTETGSLGTPPAASGVMWRHVPFTSLTKNAIGIEEIRCPTAVQSPASLHDTESTTAGVVEMLVTCICGPQAPPFSSARKAC